MNARNRILWFGDDPTDADFREAANRELALKRVSSDADVDFAQSRAAIFWARSPAKFVSTMGALERYVVQAIDYGLLIFVVVAEVGQFNEVKSVIENTVPPELRGRCLVRTMRDAEIAAHEGPNKAALYDPGPAPRMDLEINAPDGLFLDEDDVLLLKRAFHDCKSIDLQVIAGGLSGAKTLLVEAVLIASNAGPSPTPYFAKLHSSGRLIGEMGAFQAFAESHVPWNLRPNFQPERCIYGVRRGILVGSFVRGSTSLWEVARAGNGPELIRSLFEDTLAFLRREHVDGEVNNDSIASALQHFCRHDKISQERVDAAMSFGQVPTPTLLWRHLLGACPPWRRSALHGDMHGENVRVRKTDAIVIDFAHATTGPTSTDLASLEVWLAFKSVSGAHSDGSMWQSEVDSLYAPEALDEMLSPTHCSYRPWLAGCVDEIRRIAKESVNTVDEYKRVIAICLLRWASFPAEGGSPEEVERDEHRRVYAYWLAARLIASCCAASFHDSAAVTA